MNNLKDYGFIVTIILLIILNITSIYFIKNGNNILNEKIVNITKEYNKTINDNLVKTKSEYDKSLKSILDKFNQIEDKKKTKKVIPSKGIKVGDTKVSVTERKQPKGDKELSDALNFTGYPNSIMYCYSSPK